MTFQNFKELSDEHQYMILDWRNHWSIRKWMNNQDQITLNEHLIYMASLKENGSENYLVWDGEKPLGVVTYRQNTTHSADLGLYMNPKILNSGKGLEVGFFAAKFYLLKSSTIEKFCFQAHKNNFVVLRLWDFLGIIKTDSQNDFINGYLLAEKIRLWPNQYSEFKRCYRQNK